MTEKLESELYRDYVKLINDYIEENAPTVAGYERQRVERRVLARAVINSMRDMIFNLEKGLAEFKDIRDCF